MNVQQQANRLSVAGELYPENPTTELHFANGRVLRILTADLQQEPQIDRASQPIDAGEQIVLPVITEELEVGKRVVETGRVRLHTAVETYDVTLDEPLAMQGWQVERVTRHEVVSEAPPARQEGATTVYAVVEERLVVTKELLLVEEVRVTRVETERRDTQTVVLRRETVQVEREDATAYKASL